MDKGNMKFNIYYLNFSKVYEISMMINNVIKSNIQKEETNSQEISTKTSASISAGLGSKQYLADVKSGISSESSDKNMTSSKWTESMDVITTKSILLREIICKCKSTTDFNECKEGDLLKIDKLNLSILDEENLRGILVLRKDALKGLFIEGFEINNLISSMLQDYSYIIKGIFEDDKDEENAIILKLPLEIENEFENKYNVSDLLIGHLSVIGVYKGIVTEDFINKNTFTFFTNFGAQQIPEKKVFKSSIVQSDTPTEEDTRSNNEVTKFHFIDTIALIQDVQFEEPEIENIEIENINEGFWSRLLNFLHLGGKKNE